MSIFLLSHSLFLVILLVMNSTEMGHIGEAIGTMMHELGEYFADPVNRIPYIVDLRPYRKS